MEREKRGQAGCVVGCQETGIAFPAGKPRALVSLSFLNLMIVFLNIKRRARLRSGPVKIWHSFENGP